MAGDWIKFEKATPDKPEVFQIAEILGIDPDAVTGKLLRVWNWFDEHSQDGNANVTVRALLDRFTGVSGFTKAMESVGWLEIEGDQMTIPNFTRHNGQTAKKRCSTNRRVAKSRSKSAGSNTSSVTDETSEALPKALPEKRREEKSIKGESVPREREIPSISDCEEHAKNHAPSQHADFAMSVAREFHGVYSAMQPEWTTRGGDDLTRSQAWKHKLNSKIESELRSEISRASNRGKPRNQQPPAKEQDWSTDGIKEA